MNPAVIIACVLLYSKFTICAVIDNETDSSELEFEPEDGYETRDELVTAEERLHPQSDEKNYTHIFHKGWRTAMERAAIESAPFVKKASRTSAAAAMLPPYFAEKGANFGSMIAVPLEALSMLSSSLYSGITGYIVTVPIAFRSGMEVAADQIKRMKTRNPRSVKMFMKKALKKAIMKPVAILIGKDIAINGIKLKLLGKGLKYVGLQKYGDNTQDFGNDVLNAGNSIFGWGTGGWKFPFADKESDGGMGLLRFLPDRVVHTLMRLKMEDDNEQLETNELMANSTIDAFNSTSHDSTDSIFPVELNVTAPTFPDSHTQKSIPEDIVQSQQSS